jgi:hypothetical protein
VFPTSVFCREEVEEVEREVSFSQATKQCEAAELSLLFDWRTSLSDLFFQQLSPPHLALPEEVEQLSPVGSDSLFIIPPQTIPANPPILKMPETVYYFKN